VRAHRRPKRLEIFRLGTKRSFSTESAPRADTKIELERDLAELGEIGL
jgi:hypothetical protein